LKIAQVNVQSLIMKHSPKKKSHNQNIENDENKDVIIRQYKAIQRSQI